MKTICYYHKSDLDGHCSGAIVGKKYPGCMFIGVDYEDKVDRDVIRDNSDEGQIRVIVVDFCFSNDDMEWLDFSTHLIWIDHHKTSLDRMCGTEILGNQEISVGACGLTWEYFYPDEVMPEAVRMLALYDVWDHADPSVLPFQYGMRNYEDTHPDNEVWLQYLHAENITLREIVHDTIGLGRAIIKYEDTQNAKYMKSMSYTAVFHDLRALVVNKPMCNSLAFKSVYAPELHDIMISFGMKNDGKFKYTLYCDKPEIDVSAIATLYDGGGHKGAAGFYSREKVV